jgi:hypothetical protein
MEAMDGFIVPRSFGAPLSSASGVRCIPRRSAQIHQAYGISPLVSPVVKQDHDDQQHDRDDNLHTIVVNVDRFECLAYRAAATDTSTALRPVIRVG